MNRQDRSVTRAVGIRRLLEREPALAEELGALLAQLPPAPKLQALKQAGDNNRGAVVDGTGHTVSIS
jgi:hypothetical protein